MCRLFADGNSRPRPSLFSFYCSALSLQVRQAFQDNGFAFLMNVFNELNYLEDLTGLRAMQLATDLSEVELAIQLEIVLTLSTLDH